MINFVNYFFVSFWITKYYDKRLKKIYILLRFFFDNI